MALEDSVNRLATAVEKLTEILAVGATQKVIERLSDDADQADEKPAREAPANAALNGATPATPAEPAPRRGRPRKEISEEPPVNQTPPKTVPYEEVRKVVLDFVEKHGHKPAQAILGKFGVDNAKALTADKYPAVLQAFGDAAIAL